MPTREAKKTVSADVLMEILKLLPCINIMRLRCVSKAWNHTIRDPIFSKLYATIAGTTTILLDRDWPGRKLYFYKINHQKEAFHELTIDLEELGLCSCLVTEIVNGLICLYNHRDSIVCNIATHEIVSLPPQAHDCPHYPIYSLGYDPLNHEYKVLCIWVHRGEIFKCKVFSIGKDNGWREVVIDTLPYQFVPNSCSGRYIGSNVVYHNGAIQWLSNSYHEKKQRLVSFDVGQEKFRVLGVPFKPALRSNRIMLVQLGNRVAVFMGGGSFLFMLEDYRNNQVLWVERNNKVPVSLDYITLCPIGRMGSKVIFCDCSDKICEFDPNNGNYSQFLITGVRKSTESIPYSARYSICEAVENIYPLM